MHLKITKSFGHFTKDPHVMQFPVEKSLLPIGAPLLWDFTAVFCLGMVELLVVGASSSTNPRSGGGALIESCRFFFLVNSSGNGWLRDLPCWGRRALGGLGV